MHADKRQRLEEFLRRHERSCRLLTVVHTCNPRAWEVEAGRSGVQSHPELHREPGVILGYLRLTQAWRDGSVVKELSSVPSTQVSPSSEAAITPAPGKDWTPRLAPDGTVLMCSYWLLRTKLSTL